MDLHVALDDRRGRRAALEQALRDAVREGRLAPGARLPSTRELARDLGVARGTVVEAYAQLAAEGWLVTRQGATTRVAANAAGRERTRVGAIAPTPIRSAVPDADFRLGRPDLSAFPRAQWVGALRAALAETPDAALGPGDPRGSAELRSALAAYLGRVRGVIAEPERIVVCSGFAQGLRLVAEALRETTATSVIGLEDPCLPDHRATVRASGAEATALEVDHQGAVPGSDPLGAVVLTPAHQCPLGATLSAARRSEWLQTGATIVEDDYDAEFRYDRQPVGALQARAPDRVIYAGSASKTLAPALRLGWLVLPPPLLEPVIEQKRRADRGTPLLDQLALAKLITTGALDRHVRRMRLRYRRRRDAVITLLGEPFGTAAGLHVVAKVNDEQTILARAAEHGVALNGLAPFWHAEPRMQGIVIGYGTPPEHAFAAALERLAKVL